MAEVTLSARVAGALDEVALRLEDLPFVLGGSAMMACRGIPVTVGDIDLLIAGSQRSAVAGRIPDATFTSSDHPDFCTSWRVEFEAATMPVEVIGDFCLYSGDHRLAVPAIGAGERVHGIELAAVAPWVVVYRVLNPAKAALLEPLTTADDIARAAESMTS